MLGRRRPEPYTPRTQTPNRKNRSTHQRGSGKVTQMGREAGGGFKSQPHHEPTGFPQKLLMTRRSARLWLLLHLGQFGCSSKRSLIGRLPALLFLVGSHRRACSFRTRTDALWTSVAPAQQPMHCVGPPRTKRVSARQLARLLPLRHFEGHPSRHPNERCTTIDALQASKHCTSEHKIKPPLSGRRTPARRCL